MPDLLSRAPVILSLPSLSSNPRLLFVPWAGRPSGWSALNCVFDPPLEGEEENNAGGAPAHPTSRLPGEAGASPPSHKTRLRYQDDKEPAPSLRDSQAVAGRQTDTRITTTQWNQCLNRGVCQMPGERRGGSDSASLGKLMKASAASRGEQKFIGWAV